MTGTSSSTYLDHLTVERGLSPAHPRVVPAATCAATSSYLAERGVTDPSQVTERDDRQLPGAAARGRTAPDGTGR